MKLFTYWREAALVAALGGAAYLGHAARRADTERDAWAARYAATTHHADSLVTELRARDRITSALATSLDSALGGWDATRRAVANVSRETAHRAPLDTTAPAPVAPWWSPAPASFGAEQALDSALAAGDRLQQACTAYQSSCERERALAKATIDTLQQRITLLEHQPAGPRFTPYADAGYDLLAGGAALRAGAAFRLTATWSVEADATRRLAAGDTTRITAWLHHTF